MDNNFGIILFCKVPKEGFVKTRLVTDKFTPKNAKDFQIAMLLDTLSVLYSLPFQFQLIISYFPEENLQLLEDMINVETDNRKKEFLESIVYFPQTKETIGERFDESFKNAFSLDYIKHVIIVGGDTPHIDVEKLDLAYKTLIKNKDNVVIGPSQNGGFYLFGINKSDINLSSLFDSPNEFSNLLEIAYKNDLVPELLPFLNDHQISGNDR